MDLIADGLLIATALTAALYCHVLSRRLRRLSDAEAGIGAQIASLDKALEETRTGLAETRRGVAEARAALRNARDALSSELAAARAETASLAEAREALRGAIDHAEGLCDAAPPAPIVAEPGDDLDGAEMPLEVFPALDVDEPRDQGDRDQIPDWPDGVVSLPDPVSDEGRLSEPEPERGGAAPLRVERMHL